MKIGDKYSVDQIGRIFPSARITDFDDKLDTPWECVVWRVAHYRVIAAWVDYHFQAFVTRVNSPERVIRGNNCEGSPLVQFVVAPEPRIAEMVENLYRRVLSRHLI